MSDMRLRSIRFKDGYATDSLMNAMTGQGTHSDWRMANRYVRLAMAPNMIAAAYDGSGMMAKVIDIPALDKVRAWRNWQATAEQITAIEKEEKRLRLRQKVRQAEIYRGLGGAALILGLPGDPASPAPAKIGKGDLAYIHVVSRAQLAIGEIIDDYEDPDYGKPAFYGYSSTKGQQTLHPSRVIAFPGDPVANITGVSAEDLFWGKSRVERVLEAVQNSDSANGAFASLVTKVRNTVIKIPGLTDIVSTAEGEAALSKRLQAMVLGESLYNATLVSAGSGADDPGEDVDFRQVNWAGIPDVMTAFAQFIAAVSDIPITRLLGRSPAGMNATGEHDTANWNKMISAGQELDLGPCMDDLDRYLIPSALGSADDAIYYEWAPLDVPTEKELADTFKTFMEAADKLQMTGAVPEPAFAEALQNAVIERGYLPGLEGALEKVPEAERFGGKPEPEPNPMGGGDDPDPSALQANNQDAWITDASPRPLYVSRKLLNAADLVAWAKSNGFTTALPASDMHVTVLYSRTAVDPMKLGRDWREDEQGQIIVRPGGPRAIERLGENAVVLSFACPDLVWRHNEMVEAGGSHDYPEYQPHVTLTYEAPDSLDLDAVEPFGGKLIFGPERFEPLDLDWKEKVKEA